MSFPTSPPIRHTPRPWSFPAVHESQLPWGLRLAAVRVSSLPLVVVRWTFRGGRASVSEPATGAARLLSSVLRHGTAAHDSVGLAEALDQLGAKSRVNVSLDQANLSLTGQAAHLDHLLDLADELAFRPTLPEAELERERKSALEMHEHERMHAETVAARWLAWLLYERHPYGWPPTTVAGLTRASREQLFALHRSLFAPARGLLTIVGDIDPELVLARLSARYATPPMEGAPAAVVAPAPRSGRRRVVAVDRPGSEQVVVAAGHTVLPRAHPDYLPLRVANQVFGAGASSRLFLELREKRSLTYGAYSAIDAGLLGGDLIASLSTAPPKAVEALGVLLELWERFVSDPIPEDELEPARRYLVGSFPQNAAGVGGIAGLVSLGWLAGLPEDIWARYPESLAAVSAQDAMGAVARWVRPAEISAVIVGPREAAEAAACQLGEYTCGTAAEAEYEVSAT